MSSYFFHGLFKKINCSVSNSIYYTFLYITFIASKKPLRKKIIPNPMTHHFLLGCPVGSWQMVSKWVITANLPINKLVMITKWLGSMGYKYPIDPNTLLIITYFFNGANIEVK